MSSVSLTPTAGIMSVTTGSPFVMVPVLSSATVSSFAACSSDSAVLNSMPFLAPTPLPTITATGVASPKAQGQLITRTEIPLAKANPISSPSTSHIAIVTKAIAITAGTNTPDTLSAIFAIGAFDAAASPTVLIIFDKVVSSPTLVASQRIKPDWFMVAAHTLSPSALSTGMLSPVNADSFTAPLPLITTPSTGIFSPALTMNTSPFLTRSTGTVTSLPSTNSVASSGASFIRLRMASVVLPLDLASSIFPTVISVGIMAADSK